MDVVVFDLASLRYRWSDETRRHLGALSADGELLAVAECPVGTDRREAAFRACDAALGGARVSRPRPGERARRVRMPIGLYNPYSGEVAVGAAGAGAVFGGGGRLELGARGTVCSVDGDTLVCGDVTLAAIDGGYREVCDSHGAHSA